MLGARVCTTVSVAAFVFGCTTEKPVADTAPPKLSSVTLEQLRAFYYECENKSSVVVQFQPATDEMLVFLPGETARLPHVRSGSGARYSDGEVTYWSKGREALLQIRGATTRCVENRRQSVIEDAKLRGVDYWARGNEPGWRLEIYAHSLLFRTSYGQDRYAFAAPRPQVDQARGRTLYKADEDGSSIAVQIDGQTCHDSMSGERFESTVTVVLNGKGYRGCGLALH